MSEVGTLRGEIKKTVEATTVLTTKNTKTMGKKINKTKFQSLKKVNKIDKSLTRLINKDITQIIISGMKRGDFITDFKGQF